MVASGGGGGGAYTNPTGRAWYKRQARVHCFAGKTKWAGALGGRAPAAQQCGREASIQETQHCRINHE